MKYRLGDICTITKGATGIMKTIPGPYTMIALGETDKTHIEYQFDTKAVIIPLVSSTGHGHASMKRVKYCEGKFALGNILCAVIPNDESFVLAKYLHIYLHWNREELLVSQMKGMANVSLPMNRIADVMVTVPSIDKQREIIELEKQLVEKELKADSLFADQLTQLDNLNQAILQEAVQGKLVPQDPKDEPASELLKRIKAEKATLRQAQGKGKKEKPLPPIKPEEIPFDIPENWVWCRLGEIISISSGDGLTSYQMDKSGNIPVYGGNGINGYHSKFNIDSKRIVIGRVGAYCGAVHITEDKGWVTDNAFIVSYSVENIDFNWLAFFLKALDLNKLSYKGNQPVISGARVYPLVVPLPPLSEQKRIVAEIEKQFALTKQLKEHIIANQQATEQLLKALLHQAFEVKEMVIAKPKGKVIELKPTNVDYYRRTVLAAEIVWQLHKEPTLGHLKLQKLIYLCQKSADMQLPTNFLRQAMGPYDNRLMRSIDKQLKEKKWFEYKKEQVLKYQPLEKAGQHHNDFLKYFSAESEGIQFIIDKFRNVLSREIEIWATLYACMDNMLNENVIFSEASLLQRFYEWSEEKKKFSEDQIKRVFSRMKETGIIPKGFNL
jgi:type I restriction enzyme S subunit